MLIPSGALAVLRGFVGQNPEDVAVELAVAGEDRRNPANRSRAAFACGRIGAVDARADVVLALHACDTATDDAIAQAVRGEARLLLSVPCCHHALNASVRAEGPAGVLRPLLRHGILHQRTADLVTDAFRALALRVMGYRTDVVEFVSPEHTARNLMIRAVKTHAPSESRFIHEYMDMKTFFHVTPYLESALRDLLPEALSATHPSEKTPTS